MLSSKMKDKSFMKIRNKSGPKCEPRGTPEYAIKSLNRLWDGFTY